MSCVPACQHGLRANVLTCQRGLHANVSPCQRAKSVPIPYFYVTTCQRAIKRVKVSTWRSNVPKGMPIFQTFLLRNAKGSFYTLLLYKKLYVYVYVSYIKVVLYFISILHVILRKVCGIYAFWKFFALWLKKQRPGFYMLQVTSAFLEFYTVIKHGWNN